MFPPFSISEKLPTIERVQYRALSAQRTHGTIASNVFHCHPLRFLIHSLFSLLRQSHYDYATELILDWVSSICAIRRCILACVKFRSRVLTALNLLPSIATLASLNSSRRRHSTTNSRQTSPMAVPLFFRKSAIVLKTGIRLPVSQTNSMLRWHSRSRRRLDCTRSRYP